MGDPTGPRLRRHVDGRIAVHSSADDHIWLVHNRSLCMWVTEELVTGDDWTELFVAELPKPDGWVDCADSDGHDTVTPTWKLSVDSATAFVDGIEFDGDFEEDTDRLRSDALRTLAAVTAHERYRDMRRASEGKKQEETTGQGDTRATHVER